MHSASGKSIANNRGAWRGESARVAEHAHVNGTVTILARLLCSSVQCNASVLPLGIQQ